MNKIWDVILKKKKQGPKCIARTVPTLTSNVSNKKDATNEMKI